MDLYEGDSVMIMTGKLTSYQGTIILIVEHQDKPDKALVRTLDENNEETTRKYNLSNLIKW